MISNTLVFRLSRLNGAGTGSYRDNGRITQMYMLYCSGSQPIGCDPKWGRMKIFWGRLLFNE